MQWLTIRKKIKVLTQINFFFKCAPDPFKIIMRKRVVIIQRIIPYLILISLLIVFKSFDQIHVQSFINHYFLVITLFNILYENCFMNLDVTSVWLYAEICY